MKFLWRCLVIKTSVKKSINLLQKLYMNGLVPYPRVSNDFEKKPFFQLFPHPALPILKDINEPIKFDNPSKEIKVNKKTSLLFLSIIKIARPSTLEKTADKIDEFLDDNLDFINEKKRMEMIKIQELYLNFIKENSLTEKELIESGNDLYSEMNKNIIANSLSIYNIENLRFYYRKAQKSEKNKYLFAKRGKTEDIYSYNPSKEIDDGTFTSLKEFVSSLKQNKLKQANIMEAKNEQNITR